MNCTPYIVSLIEAEVAPNNSIWLPNMSVNLNPFSNHISQPYTPHLQLHKHDSPYVTLSEKLGRLVVQLVAGGSGVKFVKVTYASSRAPNDLDTRLLRALQPCPSL